MNTKQRWEMGCYGDGTFGHQHTREACADVLGDIMRTRPRLNTADNQDLCGMLRNNTGDEQYIDEEIDACDVLNAYAAVEGASWGWQDGDFGLWPVEDDT